MSDLSHWDFAERFSGYEAAALILGIEPRESAEDEHRVRVVMNRIELDYLEALETVRWEMPDSFGGFESSSTCPDELFLSVELEQLLWKFHDGDTQSLEMWLLDRRRPLFENQEFDRKKMIFWLAKVGQKSIYQFDRSANPTRLSSGSAGLHWPWGNHHTELLGHLEAAAKRFWVNYDPSDPNSANTNATVSEWLQEERKVSKNMADSIATILRPDGLPTGPRRVV